MQPQQLPDLSPWEVVEKLGEGGQCAVFRVRRADGLERAIKVMFDRSPGSFERFVAEAKLLMQLDHPNVLKVHALNADGWPPWIVMDLLGGRDLDEERQDHGVFDPERAAQIIADVASGLAKVHTMGIRHRDIKPANIMVGNDGVPRLIDFGIAREVSKAHLTQAGMVIGTLAYLPPELFDTDDVRQVQDTESADCYALGQCLYEILIGEPTYPRDGSTTKLMALVMKQKLERAFLDPREKRPQVPADLATIVKDATAADPTHRISTARDLEKRLRDWLALRNDANTAPVRRVDPTNLPPPPGRASAPQGRSTAPQAGAAPAAPVDRPSATPAPAPARGGFGTILLGLVSSVGVATALAVLGVGTVGGLAALWAFRPAPVASDPAAIAAAVRPHLVDQKANIAGCLGKTADVGVRFDVWQGRALNVQVETSNANDPRIDACVVQAVESMAFDGSPDAPIRVVLQLR